MVAAHAVRLLVMAAAYSSALAWIHATAPRVPMRHQRHIPLHFCEQPPISLEVALENGQRETVSIGCEEDVFEAAASISARHALDEEASAELEAHLYARWLDGEGEEAPPYEGPTATDGELQGVVCSIELPDVGLVLEVADSLLGGGGGRAGLGLFVRTMEVSPGRGSCPCCTTCEHLCMCMLVLYSDQTIGSSHRGCVT